MWKTAAEVLGNDLILDTGMPKRRGEYLVAGNAWNPPDQPRPTLRIRTGLGELTKTLNVVGDRVFLKDGTTPPEAFQSMPLDWTRSFGGAKFGPNPLGRGVRPVHDEAGQKFHPLPNIEYPEEMMGLPGQRPRPAGLGAIDLTWPQRQKKAGTYDRDWLEKHFPAYPPDIDWSFFNLASEDQQSAQAFAGDEEFVLQGLHPEKPRMEGRLPGFAGRSFIRRKDTSELEELATRLTTVWFFPEYERAVLVYHACTEVAEPDARDLSEIMIAADNAQQLRPASHYAEVYQRRMDDEDGLLETLRDRDLLPEGMDSSDTIDVDALLRDAAQGGFLGQNLRARARDEAEEARQKIEEGRQSLLDKGLDPGPEPDMSGFEQFSQEPEFPRSLDELPEFIEKMQIKAEESRKNLEQLEADAKEDKKATEAMIESQAENSEGNVEKFNLEPGPETLGPPKFSAEDEERKLRAQIQEYNEKGNADENLEEKLLDPDNLAFLHWTEEQLKKVYRGSVHMREPAPGKDDSSPERERLSRLIKEKSSLDSADFTGADLSGMNLAGRDLRGIFLESADLRNADLTDARLEGAVLAHARLAGARLENARLAGANLGKADLSDVRAGAADFTDAVLTEADLSGADLEGACLLGVELSNASLRGTCFAGVSARDLVLLETSLKSLDFSGADLTDAIFLQLDLTGADFSSAQLDKAVFLECLGHSVNFSGASMHNLRVVKECDFSGSNFSRTSLESSNFRGTRLMECDFSQAVMNKADFSETQACKSRFRRCVAIESQWVLSDLREADFSGANLMTASLERADLRTASLKGANLFQSDLARAHVNRKTNFDAALTRKMRTYPRKFPKELGA